MNLIDQIASLLHVLPKEAQLQVLDFAGYLVSKYSAESPSEDEAWDQLSAQERPPEGDRTREG